MVGKVILKLVGKVILKLVDTQDHLEVVKMVDRFWKTMPAALKRPTLDELYRCLRDLDYTQVNERMAVMLNAILQLEAQGECRESATEAVLMVQLEIVESREMTVGRLVTAANEVTIGGFWREHAKDELRTRKYHEVLKILSPCWEKKYMAGVFYAKETIFGAFVQELLSMPINLSLAL